MSESETQKQLPIKIKSLREEFHDLKCEFEKLTIIMQQQLTMIGSLRQELKDLQEQVNEK